MATRQIIRRGILQSFDNSSYTASVLIIEATSYVLSSVPIATSFDGTSAIAGASCAVLFFDESNHTDAVILAVYGQPIPTPTPGRVVFSTPEQEINAQVINSGATSTFSMGANIPAGALGVLYQVFFTSPTSAAYIQIAPHGGNIADYAEHGNLPAASATHRAVGIVPLGASNQIDIKANTGNCTVTLWTYGYVI